MIHRAPFLLYPVQPVITTPCLTMKVFYIWIHQSKVEVIADAILRSDVGKRVHSSDDVSLENNNDF